ncbi:MAG TPA: caspase family protein [Stellaceae bacterium]|nr:caspase family protein [Stellaceae bacterium]
MCPRRTALFFIAIALALVASGLARAQNADPPTTPFLRLDAGMHTAEITDLATDGAGALIATASTDKTVRLWHADDGSPIATLRVPIAPGAEGELNAVAIAPDGKHALAGGSTGFTFGPGFAVYLFDIERQAMIGRLAGLPAAIMDIDYAPSGKSFAIGFAKTAGIRLYDGSGKPLAEDHDYGDRVSAIAFGSDDRFAVSAYDGQIRLYDPAGHRVAIAAAPGGKHASSLAFSPDNKLIAIGYDGAARVDLVSADNLAPKAQPRAGDLRGSLSAVGWTGTAAAPVLLAAGSVRNRDDAVIVRRWAKAGEGAATDVAVGRDLVTRLAGLPGGAFAFASADPAWGTVAGTGKLAYRHGSPINDFRVMGYRRFDIAPDGLTLAFSPAAPGSPVYRFDLRARKLTKLTGAPATQRLGPPPPPVVTRMSGFNTNAPEVNGHKLALPDLELARSAAALGDIIAIGTDFNIRLFDQNGHELAAAHAVPAPVWSLASAGDNMLVAALGDGTFRWYAVHGTALTPIADLFVAADDRRWVIWTPEGFFDHADIGGKELVGYQLNHGRGDAPEFVGFDQLYRAFYAPDVVLARLQGQAASAQQRLGAIGDVRSFLQAGKLPALQWVSYCLNANCTPLDPGKTIRLPPAIAAQAQAAFVNALLPAGTAAVTLRIRIADRGSGIGPSDLFINGRNAGRLSAEETAASLHAVPGSPAKEAERAVKLDPGVNTIELRVYDKAERSYAVSDQATLFAPAPPPPKPRLFVLAAGINKYIDPAPRLDLAVTDAKSFVAAVRQGAAPLYREVDTYELYDEQASVAGIGKALDDIASKAEATDVLLVYLAGHGEQVDKDYYFITQDFRMPAADDDAAIDDAVKKQGLSGEALVTHLGKIGTKNGFLFLDTCHAGAIKLDTGAARINQESGRYILVASQSIQEALDSFDGKNGVFAYAVLEGLKGKARPSATGPVDDIDLGFYVSNRVEELAKQKDHDQSSSFKISAEDARRFPIGQPP